MSHTTMQRIPLPSVLLVGLALALLPSIDARGQEQRTILFEVLLPTDTMLEIEGYKTTSTGASRSFESPPVESGRPYAYTLKATWEGRRVTKTVILRTGSKLVFDLRPEFAAGKPTPMPKVKEADNPLKPGLSKGPAKAGFVTFIEDGRLWVFRSGSKELAAFLKDGELAKHIIRPAAGPKRMTVKGPDAETVLDYLLTQDGFEAIPEKDGERVWVFRKGSKELEAFKKDGELAKHVIRVKAGPMGMTVKAADAETIDAYMKAFGGK